MGDRIGKQLTESVGRPRVFPKILPLPHPVKTVEEQKVPVPVKSTARERAYQDTQEGIRRAANLLGISEQQVADMIVSFADRIINVVGELGKKQRNLTRQ